MRLFGLPSNQELEEAYRLKILVEDFIKELSQLNFGGYGVKPQIDAMKTRIGRQKYLFVKKDHLEYLLGWFQEICKNLEFCRSPAELNRVLLKSGDEFDARLKTSEISVMFRKALEDYRRTNIYKMAEHIFEYLGPQMTHKLYIGFRTWAVSKAHNAEIITQFIKWINSDFRFFRNLGVRFRPSKIINELAELENYKPDPLDLRKNFSDEAKSYRNFIAHKYLTEKQLTFIQKSKIKHMKVDSLLKKYDRCIDILKEEIKKNKTVYSIYLEKQIERFHWVKEKSEQELKEALDDLARIRVSHKNRKIMEEKVKQIKKWIKEERNPKKYLQLNYELMKADDYTKKHVEAAKEHVTKTQERIFEYDKRIKDLVTEKQQLN